ncbi:MAG: hypothetical protein C4530_21370 [Desulfobacteraceae bacterium]|nr:MAG: hypothetical protein C4530_21370 [Desulfobacteraceae bacterium]
MGEIKSTMDIVMEKTRHLTLSREEKEAQRKEEIGKSLKGLVVRFKDGILTMERLAEELKSIETSHGASEGLLKKEILDQIDLNGDNSGLLSLLKEICRFDPHPVEAILNAYRESILSVKGRHVSELKDRICRQWGVSGSAVVPDLEGRADWVEECQSVKDAYRQRLVKEFEKISGCEYAFSA